jgi:membrane protease YdiL (CAAX protease family)
VDDPRPGARRRAERDPRGGRDGLFRRWAQAGWRQWTIIAVSALIRGTYHLYQGFGGFVGNVVMGLVFGWLYARTKRVMPLVIAHTLLDVVAFVGYALLKDHLPWL